MRARSISLSLGLALALALLGASGLETAAGAVPAPATTGNVLVLLDHSRARAAAGRSAVRATIATLGARPAGRSVPQIGLITVRPPLGVAPAAFAGSLRRLPGVAAVQLEHRYVPRVAPNDPALTAASPYSGVVQWALAREGFYNAWTIAKGDGALVGVVDTGIDGSHPDLAPKIAAAIDQQDPSDAVGNARTDEVGHGTHVASLACAETNNGIGLAGAGYDCRLVIEKSDFSDSSIAAAIVDAADRHVQALNMSFGPDVPTSAPAPESEIRALKYAAARKVVLVAAAADSPGVEQGDPANVLQPAGTGPDLSKGIGLDVTAADYSGRRASFAGYGGEISLAAYGALGAGGGLLPCLAAPAGIFGAYPGNSTELESFPPSACRANLGASNHYAYVAGTSMAAPQVAAVGAMMRVLNPYATLADVLQTLKVTAGRGAGAGWSSDLGWGILNAGAALDAIRRVDRLPPVSRLTAPLLAHSRVFTLRWSGHDQEVSGLIASGIARYAIYVRVGRGARLLATTTGRSLRFRGRRGVKCVFWSMAIDAAGNRESRPVSVTTRVARDAR